MISQDEHRKWYWYAAKARTEDDLSLLAIYETIVACAVAIAIGIWLARWGFMLFASVIAPFLLLRTEQSTKLGVKLFERVVSWWKRWLPGPPQKTLPDDYDYNELYGGGGGEWIERGMSRMLVSLIFVWGKLWIWITVCLALHGLYYLTLIVVSIGIRLIATIWCVARYPLQSIAAIPTNWRRICLCADMTKPLEVVPGMTLFPHGPYFSPEQTDDRPTSFTALFALILRRQTRKEAYWVFMVRPSSDGPAFILYFWLINGLFFFIQQGVLLVVVSLMISSHVLAWWYRWSLKSTALVWLPLLYIAADVVPTDWSAARRLETNCNSATGKIVRAYALFVITLLLLKFGVQIVWYKLIASLERSHPWLWALAPLVRPIDAPVWQVCSLLNAIAAWGLYAICDWQLRKRQYGEGWSDAFVHRFLSAATMARWGITIYTSVCTLYAIYLIVRNSHPPEWRFRLFPWEW